MRILLADDQMDVRSGLKILLEQEEQMKVAGEASGITELLLQTKELKPDVLLLDWELSNLPMGEVVPILRTLAAGIRIVALSGRPESYSTAMAAGVDAFVSKGDPPEKLLDTLNEIYIKGDEE